MSSNKQHNQRRFITRNNFYMMILVAVKRMLLMKRQRHNSVAYGFNLLRHSQKIIITCQQHRMINNNVLQGNSALKQKLIVTQRHMDNLVVEGNQLGLNVFSQWQSFKEHWSRLKLHALNRDLPASNLFRQHSVMIEGQLSLVDEVTHYYEMNSVILNGEISAARLCSQLLRVSESIAQLRGMGVGVCARGLSEDGIDEIYLSLLMKTVTTANDDIIELLKNSANPALADKIANAIDALQNSVNELILVTKQRLLQRDEERFDGEAYFIIATQPIEQLMAVFDSVTAYVDQQLPSHN